ncbi:MAG TPA: VCBS repeat-containing protein [Methylomirabilota bacterium]|nr:VCBS repeat-containing protein [Methylomirabilota bacterium]
MTWNLRLQTLFWLVGGLIAPAIGQECTPLFPVRIDHSGLLDVNLIAAGDLNGDGFSDVVAGQSGGALVVLLGNGDGTLGPPGRSYSVGAGTREIILVDVDADGDLGIVTVNAVANTVSVLRNRGNAEFDRLADSYAGRSPSAVAAGRLNGDGHVDLLVANADDRAVSMLLGDGSGLFERSGVFTVGNRPASVVLADLDGDGDLDAAVANANSYNVSILLNNGDGTFAEQAKRKRGGYDIVAGDLDDDGDADLAVGGAFEINVFLNRGDGSFSLPTAYPVSGIAGRLAIADFDRDGNLNIEALVGFDPAYLLVFRGNSTGRYGEPEVYNAGTSTADLAIADFDRDLDTDLAIPSVNTDTIYVFLNQFPGDCPGDFDRDGCVDAQDVLAFLNAFNAGDPAADLDGNGVFDGAGLLLFLALFDAGC